MEQLGYYAKDVDGNLHQFTWGQDGKLFIKLPFGVAEIDLKKVEIVQVGIINADTPTRQPKRVWEVIDTGVEINEDFLPNDSLTYTISFDGVDSFEANIQQCNFDRNVVGVEDAPKTIYYRLDKPIEQFTEDEKIDILAYRGLHLSDGFTVNDIFMEKSHVTFDGVDIEISAKVRHKVMIAAGESSQDLRHRTFDIMLHGAGDDGHLNKEDIGADGEITFI